MSTIERDSRSARLADYERELDADRFAYEAAKALIDRPTHAAALHDAVKSIDDMIGSGPLTGEAALYLLGQIAQVVRALRAPTRRIERYEALRESARKLREAIGG